MRKAWYGPGLVAPALQFLLQSQQIGFQQEIESGRGGQVALAFIGAFCRSEKVWKSVNLAEQVAVAFHRVFAPACFEKTVRRSLKATSRPARFCYSALRPGCRLDLPRTLLRTP